MENQIDAQRDNLVNLSPEEQKNYMEEWFRGNYEDPAERTPYDKGYIYIWGGPYDAYEELIDQFSEEVPEELIQELAEELTGESPEWTNKERPEDYDDFIESNPEYFHSFTQALVQINQALNSTYNEKIKEYLLKLLYINVITALETYLSEAFITLVFAHPNLTRAFVENNKDFNKQTIAISELYNTYENIALRIKAYLSNLIWHKLEKVEKLYTSTLGVQFDNNKASIYKAIINRHHLVHRGGKDNDGVLLKITEADLNLLIKEVTNFVSDLDSKLNEIIKKNQSEDWEFLGK